MSWSGLPGSSDSRVAAINALLPEKRRCPVIACHMGDAALIYQALVVGPDGRQRAVAGCVKHLDLLVAKAVSQIRVEPFD